MAVCIRLTGLYSVNVYLLFIHYVYRTSDGYYELIETTNSKRKLISIIQASFIITLVEHMLCVGEFALAHVTDIESQLYMYFKYCCSSI